MKRTIIFLLLSIVAFVLDYKIDFYRIWFAYVLFTCAIIYYVYLRLVRSGKIKEKYKVQIDYFFLTINSIAFAVTTKQIFFS